MKKRKLAVFDVCGTITATNNTSDFIGFVLKSDRSLRYVLLVLIRVVARLSGILRMGSAGFCKTLRMRQIALLKGYSSARLHEMAERYVHWLDVKKLWNTKVLDVLEKERERGKEVLLVSAAIDPPIRQIARKLGIGCWYCSELEMSDQRCTGMLKTDLLGRKESILTQLSGDIDWPGSSVYSDNPEDVPFMERFGMRTIVVNGVEPPPTSDASFQYLFSNRIGRACYHNSVNERNVKWIYLPFMYYSLSRFHRVGLLVLFLHEIVPLAWAGFFATDYNVLALALMPLSHLVFYSIYEIGGLVNDLLAKREPPATRLQRIAPQVNIHVGLFVAIRFAFVGLVWAVASARGYSMSGYITALAICLAVYLLHTLILGRLRILTFFLLKICRTSVPLVILAPQLDGRTLLALCAIFTALEAPWRLYAYSYYAGLIRGALVRWMRVIRMMPGVVLTLLGVVIYLLSGWWFLFVVALYYALLDTMSAVRMKGQGLA